MGCDVMRQIACGQEGLVGQIADKRTGSARGQMQRAEQRARYRYAVGQGYGETRYTDMDETH